MHQQIIEFNGVLTFCIFPISSPRACIAIELGAAPKRQRRLRAAAVSEPNCGGVPFVRSVTVPGAKNVSLRRTRNGNATNKRYAAILNSG